MWVKGWKCKLIHFPNGKIEKGCEFKEFMSAPFLIGNISGQTKWTTVYFNLQNHHIHFCLDNKISSSKYKIEMSSEYDNKTKCTLELTYKPINSKGIKFIANNGEKKIEFLISALGSMLKYYSESSEMYTTNKNSRLLVYLQYFTKADKLKLMFNKLVLHLYIDRNKKSFLAGNPIYLEGSR